MLIAWWWACSTMSPERRLEAPAQHVRRVAPPASSPGIASGVRGLSVVAMGDILVHRAVVEAAEDFAEARDGDLRRGYDALFEGIRPLVQGADLAFVNLETPVAPSRFRPRRGRVFNADPWLVDSLVDTGFDLVNLANNHAFDQGPAGLEETMGVLGERALPFVGVGSTCDAAHSPVIVEQGGLVVAFFAATEILNEDWNVRDDATCASTLDPDAILARVGAAREQGADFVVLSLHWGEEYEPDPGPERRRIAEQLVEGGVDVILGHHAHVLQPVELRVTGDGRTALIAYGLGNLISNQAAWYVPGRHARRSARPRDGLALSFRLTRRTAGDFDVHRAIVDVEAVPLWTVNNQPTRTRASGTEIRVLPTRDAVHELVGDDATADARSDDRRAWAAELERRARSVEEQAAPVVVTSGEPTSR